MGAFSGGKIGRRARSRSQAPPASPDRQLTRQKAKLRALPPKERLRVARNRANELNRNAARELARQRLKAKPEHHGPLSGITHAVGSGLHLLYPKGKGKGHTPGATARPPRGVLALHATTPGRAATETGRAFYEDPGHVSLNTLKGAGSLIAGSVAAPVELTLHPSEIAKIPGRLKEDAERRYGDLDTKAGRKRFRERIKKEGAAPEIADAAALVGGVVGGTSRAVGSIARASARKTGRANWATHARPDLRIAPGETGAKPQNLRKGAIGIAGQRLEDKARRRALEKRDKADLENERDVRGIRPQEGEVVHRTLRKQNRAAVGNSGGIQSRGFIRHRQDKGREDVGGRKNPGMTRAHVSLPKVQRPAMFHVLQGLVDVHDPKAAREFLEGRERDLAAKGAPKTRSPYKSERGAIAHQLEHLDEIYGGEAGRRLDAHRAAEVERSKRIAEGDPRLQSHTAQASRHGPQGRVLGVSNHYHEIRDEIEQDIRNGHVDEETGQAMLKELEGERKGLNLDFVRRVEAERGNLPEPAFFHHERPRARVFHVETSGTGKRAVQGPKQREYKLFDTGRADVSFDAYRRGQLTSLKRKHNYRLTLEQLEANAVPWTKEQLQRGGRGLRKDHLTIHQLENVRRQAVKAERNGERGVGLREEDYAYYNPGLIRGADNEKFLGDVENPNSLHDLQGDLSRATYKNSSDIPEEYRMVPGWRMIPRKVYDELHRNVGPPSKAGRVWDKVHGFQQGTLLGSSPAWLQIQIASNAILTGLAVRNPANVIGAIGWWRSLDQAEKDAADEYLGQGVARSHTHKTHLGSTGGDIAAGWDMFSKTAFGQWGKNAGSGAAMGALWGTAVAPGVGTLVGAAAGGAFHGLVKRTPFELIFAGDEKTTSAMRRLGLYTAMKRTHFRQMAETSGKILPIQEKIASIAKLPPKEQMRAMTRDQRLLEQHAEYVNKFLGDYTTFTHAERKGFKRYVMFYGFLRYSMRTLFWTLPVQHPLIAVTLAELSKLHNDEIDDLLGGPGAPWMYASLKGGTSLARLNPISNAYVDSLRDLDKRPGKAAIVGFSPLIQSLTNQAYAASAFSGNPYRVRGESQSAQYTGGYGPDVAGRIFLDELLSTMLPYRAAEKATQKGAQGADSLLFSARPTEFAKPKPYKTKSGTYGGEAYKRNQRQIREELSPRQETLTAALPLLFGDRTAIPHERRRLREQAAADKPKRRKPKSNNGGFPSRGRSSSSSGFAPRTRGRSRGGGKGTF